MLYTENYGILKKKNRCKASKQQKRFFFFFFYDNDIHKTLILKQIKNKI